MEINSSNLCGTNGVPGCATYTLDTAHTITEIAIQSEKVTSDLKMNLSVGDKKSSFFGTGLVFALCSDKSLTRIYRSMWSTHMKEWLNAIDPSEKCTQSDNGEMPVYNATDEAVRFPTSDYMNVPTTPFSFSSSKKFSIFMATHTISAPFNAVYLLGGDNSSGTTALSAYGMESGRKTIRDQSGNTDQSTDDAPASSEIRCISRRSNGTIDEWVDGVQIETALSGFTGAFDFRYINASKDNNGNKIQGGTWYVHEILIYEDSTDSMVGDEREDIEGYLAYKYGLESNLPSGHKWENSDPRGSGYDTFVLSSDLDLSNGKNKYDPSSTPSFNTGGGSSSSDWDTASLSQAVSANETVRIFPTDFQDVGKILIKVTYT